MPSAVLGRFCDIVAVEDEKVLGLCDMDPELGRWSNPKKAADAFDGAREVRRYTSNSGCEFSEDALDSLRASADTTLDLFLLVSDVND